MFKRYRVKILFVLNIHKIILTIKHNTYIRGKKTITRNGTWDKKIKKHIHLIGKCIFTRLNPGVSELHTQTSKMWFQVTYVNHAKSHYTYDYYNTPIIILYVIWFPFILYTLYIYNKTE